MSIPGRLRLISPIDTEARFRTVVVAAMRAAMADVFSVHGHAMQQPGWPDCHVVSPLCGGMAWVELKGAKTTLRDVQRACIRRINYKGGFAVVLRARPGRQWVIQQVGEDAMTDADLENGEVSTTCGPAILSALKRCRERFSR